MTATSPEARAQELWDTTIEDLVGLVVEHADGGAVEAAAGVAIVDSIAREIDAAEKRGAEASSAAEARGRAAGLSEAAGIADAVRTNPTLTIATLHIATLICDRIRAAIDATPAGTK